MDNDRNLLKAQSLRRHHATETRGKIVEVFAATLADFERILYPAFLDTLEKRIPAGAGLGVYYFGPIPRTSIPSRVYVDIRNIDRQHFIHMNNTFLHGKFSLGCTT